MAERLLVDAGPGRVMVAIASLHSKISSVFSAAAMETAPHADRLPAAGEMEAKARARVVQDQGCAGLVAQLAHSTGEGVPPGITLWVRVRRAASVGEASWRSCRNSLPDVLQASIRRGIDEVTWIPSSP